MAALAEAFPQTPIILCHLGTPVAIGGPFAGLGKTMAQRAAIYDSWADALAKLAEHPNVSVKLSGLTMPVLGWGYHTLPSPPGVTRIVDDLAPLVKHAIESFGVERCMFASNFPVDRVSTSFAR